MKKILSFAVCMLSLSCAHAELISFGRVPEQGNPELLLDKATIKKQKGGVIQFQAVERFATEIEIPTYGLSQPVVPQARPKVGERGKTEGKQKMYSVTPIKFSSNRTWYTVNCQDRKQKADKVVLYNADGAVVKTEDTSKGEFMPPATGTPYAGLMGSLCGKAPQGAGCSKKEVVGKSKSKQIGEIP